MKSCIFSTSEVIKLYHSLRSIFSFQVEILLLLSKLKAKLRNSDGTWLIYRVAHFYLVNCQNSSDLQISNSFEKLRSFCIYVHSFLFQSRNIGVKVPTTLNLHRTYHESFKVYEDSYKSTCNHFDHVRNMNAMTHGSNLILG